MTKLNIRQHCIERACPFFCKKLLRLLFLKYCSKWELKVANWLYGHGLQIETVSRTRDDLGDQEKFNPWTLLQRSLINTAAALVTHREVSCWFHLPWGSCLQKDYHQQCLHHQTLLKHCTVRHLISETIRYWITTD